MPCCNAGKYKHLLKEAGMDYVGHVVCDCASVACAVGSSFALGKKVRWWTTLVDVALA
jgi:hypothetical protein